MEQAYHPPQLNEPKAPVFPWKKVLLEIVTIALGITLGFTLERWNENRRDRLAETKILLEMRNGLALDTTDMSGNIVGHDAGIAAARFYRRLVTGKAEPDSFLIHYNRLFRGFVAIQNTSAYEALKAAGLQTVTNDSLRYKIISLYDFDYQILFKLEETYAESQFVPLYYNEVNRILAPFYVFNEEGKMTGIRHPKLAETDRAVLLTILRQIIMNRDYNRSYYITVIKRVEQLMRAIDNELAR
jgi:hypothetical protein